MNVFDLVMYDMLNQFAGHVPVLDQIMSFVAQYALQVYGILFIVAWFSMPKPETGRRHALVIMVLSGVLALLVNVVISHIWFRPRPFVALPKGGYTQLIPHSVDASFPSDHTSGSFGFAAGSWHNSAKWVQNTFTYFAILVAISRVYCGVHWPTDVIAGAIVGILSSLLMWRVNKLLLPLTNLGLRLFRLGTYYKAKPSKNL